MFPFLYDKLVELPFLFPKDQGTNLSHNPTLRVVFHALTFEGREGSLYTTYMTYTQSV